MKTARRAVRKVGASRAILPAATESWMKKPPRIVAATLAALVVTSVCTTFVRAAEVPVLELDTDPDAGKLILQACRDALDSDRRSPRTRVVRTCHAGASSITPSTAGYSPWSRTTRYGSSRAQHGCRTP